MSGSSQNSRGKPSDLSNIMQGDDSNHGLNTSLNNTTPSDFQVPGGGNNSDMDSRNNGDHDASGRFNPMGGLPNVSTHQPGDPSFTRQLGPLMGGKHADDDDEGLQFGDAANGPTFNKTDSRISDLAHNAAPKLGQRRDDEPDGDSFGLDPSQDKLSSISQPVSNERELREEPSVIISIKEHDTTIQRCFKLRYPLPLHLNHPGDLASGLEKICLKYLVMSSATCLFLGHAGYSLFLFIIASATGAAAFYMLSLEVLNGLEWQIEKTKGSKILSCTTDGESMEWFNYITESVWRCIDPKIFDVVEDILEDAISKVLPSFIKAVKVSDFELGIKPPRIQRIQIYSPTPKQASDCIFGEVEFSLKANASNTRTTSDNNRSTTPPGVSIRFKTQLNAAVDIRGELTKLTGKMRFKIATSHEPPFVSKITISFIRAPLVETAVMPITQKLNIMKLPLLKALVNEGVKLGFKSLAEPNSITIDIDPIVPGLKADTDAIGVVKVEVRRAKRLSPGIKDSHTCFVTLSLSDNQKNDVKSTRVLNNNFNPIWNEPLYQLVTPEDVTKDVYLDIKVWEADKVRSDSLWGSISASVKDIVLAKLDEHGNISSWCTDERIMFDGWAPIDGKSEKESKTSLEFKLSFHPKYVLPKPSLKNYAKVQKAEKEKAEKKEQKKRKKRMSKKEKKLLKAKLKQKRKEDKHIRSRFIFNRIEEKEEGPKVPETIENPTINEKPNFENGEVTAVSDNDSDLGRTQLISCEEEIEEIDDSNKEFSDEEEYILPPFHASGILSLTLVKGADLEILDPKVISFKQRRHPYKSNKAVSPYANLYIDDTKVFRTRSKMRNANPNWNASTECFLKNYNTSYLRVSIKNNMDQEEDPVIGTAVLKLINLFGNSSSLSKESKQWITLLNGIGYGKVLLHLKFKPIKLRIPRELSGADVGTLIIDKFEFIDVIGSLNADEIASTKASLSINVEPVIIKQLKPDTLKQNGNVWEWSESYIYLPLMMRYRSALNIQVSQGSIGSFKASACLWMKEIYDNDWQNATLALCEYTNKEAANELSWGAYGTSGCVKLRLKFVPGFSPAHTELPEFTTDMLGANLFQMDDSWNKAHLLVRKEGTENYAIDTTFAKRKSSRQKLMDQIAARKMTADSIEVEEGVSLLTINDTKEKNNSVCCNDSPNSVVADYNRRKSSAVTFDLSSSKILSTASSGSNTLFDSDSDRNLYASSSTNDRLGKDDRRVSNSILLNNDGDKLNEAIEIDTVEYLEEKQKDLKNFKIHRYKIIRRLSKGKKLFLKKVQALTHGYNSQVRADRAVVNEL